MIGVTILGSTGTIGANTLDVLARHPDTYRVVALTAHNNDQRLWEQCQVFQPDYAVLADGAAAARLQQRLQGGKTQVLAGAEALVEVAALAQTDYVMAAIVGAAGLRSTLAAAAAGKRVLLANKEALVMSGPLFMEQVRRHGARLLPIDSEHNAVFQCLPAGFDGDPSAAGIRRILLTGSGGPFRTLPMEQLARVTPAQACKHPNWTMGKKISVDSATMMNKGLEVIEAHWLFGAAAEQIEVVLHPQSIVHSLVEYTDGSVLAQWGQPDMRTPIAHALAWPGRMVSGVEPLDIAALGQLEFGRPEQARFPCLALAYAALATGGSAPTVLNAANEVAVAAFLAGRLNFTAIAQVVEKTLEKIPVHKVESLDQIEQIDAEARAVATAIEVDRRS